MTLSRSAGTNECAVKSHIVNMACKKIACGSSLDRTKGLYKTTLLGNNAILKFTLCAR